MPATPKLPETPAIEIASLRTFYHFHFATGYVFRGERHPFWEMVYVINGQVDIGADDRVHALSAGDLIFHQPDEYHSIWANYAHAPDMIVVTFDCGSDAMRYFQKRCLHLGEPQRARIHALLDEAYRVYGPSLSGGKWIERPGSTGGAYTLRLLLTVFLTSLLGSEPAARQKEAPAVSVSEKADEEQMEKAISFMKAHLRRELRFAALCRHMGMSGTAVKELFRRNCASAPIAYFERLRMIEAQKLMRQGCASVSALADALGFSSPSYFSTRYKHTTGQTPREYLKEIGAR